MASGKRTGPAGNGTGIESLGSTAHPTASTEIAAQLRRRRGASRRLEQLHDGRRDTLDPPRPFQPITMRAVGEHSVEFYGPGVKDAIATLGVKHMWSRTGRGWLVHQGHADDLEALLTSRGYSIEYTL